MNKNFSRECIYKKCNLEHHCIGISLIHPCVWEDDVLLDHINVLEVILSDSENEVYFTNVLGKNPLDTYGNITVKAFRNDPFKTKEIVLNTQNIKEILLVNN